MSEYQTIYSCWGGRSTGRLPEILEGDLVTVPRSGGGTETREVEALHGNNLRLAPLLWKGDPIESGRTVSIKSVLEIQRKGAKPVTVPSKRRGKQEEPEEKAPPKTLTPASEPPQESKPKATRQKRSPRKEEPPTTPVPPPPKPAPKAPAQKAEAPAEPKPSTPKKAPKKRPTSDKEIFGETFDELFTLWDEDE